VLAARVPDAKGAVDDLVVRGGGDPVLNSEDWWRLAADLHRSGLRRVRGDVLVDDSAFDHEFWRPSWGHISARAYHAPIGALTANYGAFFVRVSPAARSGGSVRVEIDPPVGYLKVVNRAVTGSSRSTPSLVVERGKDEGGREVVAVRGVVRAGDEPDLFPRSVKDPALYAGAVLAMQLEANGIAVDGRVRRVAESAEGAELLRFRGRPLSRIVQLFMKYSNNAIAESLVKAMGRGQEGSRPGSWSEGLAEMRRRLERLGLPLDDLVFVDGSGLSPRDRVSPRLLVAALRVGRRSFGFGPEFVAAFPIAARDGTLEKRASGSLGHVRAKTGLLSDQRVTSLSGFAALPTGETALFSILVNGYHGDSQTAMKALDEWLAQLVRSSGSGGDVASKSPASGRAEEMNQDRRAPSRSRAP